MHRAERVFLMIVTILNGLAGLVCGILFLIRPDGSLLQAGALLPEIAKMPMADTFFQDFTWIGIAMLLVLALPNLAAAVVLVRRSEMQYRFTLAAGVLLLVWCGYELVFMFNAAAVGYFVVGVLTVLASMLLLRTHSWTGA